MDAGRAHGPCCPASPCLARHVPRWEGGSETQSLQEAGNKVLSPGSLSFRPSENVSYRETINEQSRALGRAALATGVLTSPRWNEGTNLTCSGEGGAHGGRLGRPMKYNNGRFYFHMKAFKGLSLAALTPEALPTASELGENELN